MSRITPLLGLTLLIAGVPAFAQVLTPKSGDVLLTQQKPSKNAGTKPPVTKGVAWKFAFEKGRVTKFKGKFTFSGNLSSGVGFTMETQGISKEAVTSVSKSGDGTVDSIIETEETTINGEPLPNDASRKHTVTTSVMGANGKVISWKSTQKDEATETLDKISPIISSMPVPPQPVEVGDEWKTEFPNPFLPEQKVVMTSQFAERTKFGTLGVYRIQINLLLPVREDDAENKDAIQVSGYYDFETVKRRMVKTEMTVDNIDLKVRGEKVRVSMNGVIAMIGVPDQITPRTVKNSGKGKRKK